MPSEGNEPPYTASKAVVLSVERRRQHVNRAWHFWWTESDIVRTFVEQGNDLLDGVDMTEIDEIMSQTATYLAMPDASGEGYRASIDIPKFT